jgi:hypothetical protein
MNNPTSFAVSGKGRAKGWTSIAVNWLGPIIAWLAVLAISFAAVGALLGER